MEMKVLLAVAMVVVPVILSKLIKYLLLTKPKLKLTPRPWTLPLIGSLHHLMSNPLPHRAMRDLARKHGPLMMLWLGELPTVVASSREAAHAILKTNDVTFAERHRNHTINIITFNGMSLMFGSYGERWRQLRRLSLQELLSAARVRSFQRIREEEVARFTQSLATSAAAGAAVDLDKMISVFVRDLFFREIMGSRCKQHDEFLAAMNTAVRISGELSIDNILPSLSRLLQKLGLPRRCRALACRDRLMRIIGPIIRETKEAMDQGDKNSSDEGLIAVLLRLQKDEASLPIELTNEVVMALLFDLFSAGTDTTSTALIWCMTELIRNPATMAKAQAEVREAFEGKTTTTITENDLTKANLSYFKCVVKEALRLHCPASLVPRMCRETCQVMGYDIPKGTSVFINVWAICRDAKYWEDPDEFKPERFESSNLDYKGTDFEFLPFGSGRRICPGLNLGVANIELALASILYHFDWKLPSGVEPNDVDISEAPGPVTKKNTALLVHPVTRSFAPVNT